MATKLSSFFNRCNDRSLMSSLSSSLQQSRGIRVKVLNGNLDQALALMQRKMQSSGIERLIKQEQTHHIKNSEKRVLARKALYRKLGSQDLARKLKAILIKKVRYPPLSPISFCYDSRLDGSVRNLNWLLAGKDYNFFEFVASLWFTHFAVHLRAKCWYN